jgi:penicillin-binding protein 1A
VLAVISTVFGMMMAVASDLPQLENTQQFYYGHDSYLFDDHWRPIGLFAPPNHYVIDSWNEISQAMVHAIVAVEDKRFWSDPGIDIRGIARAFISDITGGPTQGASTIAQQFVKNTLHAENNRTVFEKLREAALAFQLTHKWKRNKILTEYLNSIYFGNGAYGIESAARIYFGKAPNVNYDPSGTAAQGACGDATPGNPLPKCASKLTYYQAALLAGMVANPSAFDPTEHRQAALARRDLVLKDMLAQRYITRLEYEEGNAAPLPSSADLQTPQEPAAAPYFTSWLRPQILAAMGYHRGLSDSYAEYRAYYGGLKIRTTLDLALQQAADQAVANELPYGPDQPTVSLVAIDNRTGQVRAMVGGPIVNGQEDYSQYPFNLATEAERQPGSAFKPFTLATALQVGYGPDSLFTSAPFDIRVPHGTDIFHVRNFGNQYSGTISLQGATDYSVNSVYARLGIIFLKKYGGTKRIAQLARAMGIRTPVSNNYAMILGGLKVGVSTLDMAHAYETFATGGRRVYNQYLGAPHRGPIGIAEIQCPICRHHVVFATPSYERVLPANIAALVHQMLEGPVARGTATQAAIPGVVVAGKTGTTTNYADAWFVGWTPQLTTAVWVGFPDKLVPMTTLYNGQPVEGGTFPAVIWHNFMVQALQILATEAAASHANGPSTSTTSALSTPSTVGTSQPTTTSTTSTSTTPGKTTGGATTPNSTSTTPTATTPSVQSTTPSTGHGGGQSSGSGGASPGGGAAPTTTPSSASSGAGAGGGGGGGGKGGGGGTAGGGGATGH